MKNYTTKEHYEKYQRMAKTAGVSLKDNNYFPTKERLLELYQEDQNLNSISLYRFDRLFNPCTPNFPRTLAENVCMYKHLLIYEVLECEPVFEN